MEDQIQGLQELLGVFFSKYIDTFRSKYLIYQHNSGVGVRRKKRSKESINDKYAKLYNNYAQTIIPRLKNELSDIINDIIAEYIQLRASIRASKSGIQPRFVLYSAICNVFKKREMFLTPYLIIDALEKTLKEVKGKEKTSRSNYISAYMRIKEKVKDLTVSEYNN